MDSSHFFCPPLISLRNVNLAVSNLRQKQKNQSPTLLQATLEPNTTGHITKTVKHGKIKYLTSQVRQMDTGGEEIEMSLKIGPYFVLQNMKESYFIPSRVN